MKRILIDGRFIGVGDSISRYTLGIVEGILKLDKVNQYTLLVRPQAKSQISNLKSQNYGNLSIKVLDIKHYSLGEQTALLYYLNKEKFDLVHFTQFNHPIYYNGKYVITIFDLTMVGHLHRQNIIKRLAFKTVMKSAVLDSQKIITSSNTTMDDVCDSYKVSNDKFSVIYLGVDHARFNARIKNKELRIKQFKEKYSIKDDYVLYTGMWKKHKNLIRMLLAFEEFLISNFEFRNKSQNTNVKMLQLVLVGKIDTKEPEVINEIERINKSLATSYQLPTAVITTGFIEEEELPISYAGAIAYCIPSLSEGFGWPPLEAMACGTPVISSKESCMPEVLGDAALYFDAYDEKDIAKAIEKITNDARLRRDLVEKGYKQVKKYNWEQTAKETLEVYKSILD